MNRFFQSHPKAFEKVCLYIQQENITDASTQHAIYTYAEKAFQLKLNESPQLPLQVTHEEIKRNQVAKPYNTNLDKINNSNNICDFITCTEIALPLNQTFRADVQRCSIHLMCCTYPGCVLPAEFRIPFYKTFCVIHNGCRPCKAEVFDEETGVSLGRVCSSSRRSLSKMCYKHEQQFYKLKGIACTFPTCTENKYSTRLQYNLCAGPFQRCFKHGGKWFCKFPKCIEFKINSYGYCTKHYIPLRPMLDLVSLCIVKGCEYPISQLGCKTLGLCELHFRTETCSNCGTPNTCSATNLVCAKCRARIQKNKEVNKIAVQTLDTTTTKPCPQCNIELIPSFWKCCTKCIQKDTCNVCYGQKSVNATMCHECRVEYNKVYFQTAQQIFRKELETSQSVYSHYSAHDSRITCATNSKRRPDFLYVLPKHVVIVELDEKFHVRYSLINEFKRIWELALAIKQFHKQKNMYVIRVNSDCYTIQTVLSCIENACTCKPHILDKKIIVDFIGYPDSRYSAIFKLAEKINKNEKELKSLPDIIIGTNYGAYGGGGAGAPRIVAP